MSLALNSQRCCADFCVLSTSASTGNDFCVKEDCPGGPIAQWRKCTRLTNNDEASENSCANAGVLSPSAAYVFAHLSSARSCALVRIGARF